MERDRTITHFTISQSRRIAEETLSKLRADSYAFADDPEKFKLAYALIRLAYPSKTMRAAGLTEEDSQEIRLAKLEKWRRNLDNKIARIADEKKDRATLLGK